nr:NAD(P)H-dependent oxidoreductase [Maribacter polysiphoniae]
MKNIFIINGSHPFAHSGGRFNETLFTNTISYFDTREEFEVKFTQVGENYNVKEEVEKFKWADIVIYHTPIWWFQIPFGFKKYIDEVFTEGHQNGIYASDGRSRKKFLRIENNLRQFYWKIFSMSKVKSYNPFASLEI